MQIASKRTGAKHTLRAIDLRQACRHEVSESDVCRQVTWQAFLFVDRHDVPVRENARISPVSGDPTAPQRSRRVKSTNRKLVLRSCTPMALASSGAGLTTGNDLTRAYHQTLQSCLLRCSLISALSVSGVTMLAEIGPTVFTSHVVLAATGSGAEREAPAAPGSVSTYR